MLKLNLLAIVAMVTIVASAIIAGSLFTPGNYNSSVTSLAGGNASIPPPGDNKTGMNITIFGSSGAFNSY